MQETTTLRFPFLAIRENGEPFEYLLEEINEEKAIINVSSWMVNHHVRLNLNEQINLFIPNVLTLIYQFRHNTPGIVTEIKKENDKTIYYTISFEEKSSHIPKASSGVKELAEKLPLGQSMIDLLSHLVKDIIILKQGVLVYLKHLSPYFSRIVNYSYNEYQILKNFIFEDVKNKIIEDTEHLQSFYDSLKQIKTLDDIAIYLNLEYLRENIESEVNLDLFLVAFANLSSKENLLDLFKNSQNQENLKRPYFYVNYLISIKELEKRLYSNYNQIVLIYLKSI